MSEPTKYRPPVRLSNIFSQQASHLRDRPQIRALMEGAAEIIVRIIASSPTDFRDVFGEVAYKHLGATNLKAVFPGYAADQTSFAA